jgi:hypothetical protein
MIKVTSLNSTDKPSEVMEVTEINILYDLYNGLLSKRQSDIIEMYYCDNLSLAEIAEHLDISRQAVYDTLKRAVKILRRYETVLQLASKYSYENRIYKSVLRAINKMEKQLYEGEGDKKNNIKILEDIKDKITEIIEI